MNWSSISAAVAHAVDTTLAGQLQALNYVQYVYRTGVDQGILTDAIRDKNFDPVVAQAARTTRRRSQAYAFSAAEVQAAARLANSWCIAATADGFLLGHLGQYDQMAGTFAVKSDGMAVSVPSKLAFAGDPAPAPNGDDDPASVATVSQDQPWTLGVNTNQALTIRRSGTLLFAAWPDGHAWAAQGGMLKAEQQFAYSPAPTLRVMWPPHSAAQAYADWSFVITFGGEFALLKGDKAVLVFDPDGTVWNAGAGGKLLAAPSTDAVVPTPSAAELVIAGAISIGGATYNSATSWVSGTADDVGEWFRGSAGSVADGFETGGTYVAATAQNAANWVAGAGATGANAIAGAATAAANAAADAAKSAGETVAHTATEVAKKLDPTSW